MSGTRTPGTLRCRPFRYAAFNHKRVSADPARDMKV